MTQEPEINAQEEPPELPLAPVSQAEELVNAVTHGIGLVLSIVGAISKILFSHRVDAVAVWLYVLLGWMPIATVPSLMEVVPAAALWWMLP